MQDVADQFVAPTTIRVDLRNIHLIGAEPIDPAGHIAVARRRGEDVKTQHIRRGYRWAAGALFGAHSGGKRTRGPENPSQSSSFKKRGWTASGFTVSC